MDNKNVIIIILAVVLVVIAVGCLYFVSMPTAGDNNHVNETNITNNVTNVSQEDNQISTSSDNSDKSYGSQKEYDDWQEDYETGEPYTAHTTNPVPFILVNADPAYKLREGGCLADIAPTLIELMGMEQPAEMTGKSLLVK